MALGTHINACCLIGFTDGLESFRASGYVHLTSSDNSITIDASSPGVIDLIAVGGGGGGGSVVTGLSHSFNAITNVLTTTLTQTSGTSPLTATATIPIEEAGSTNETHTLAWDSVNNILTSVITQSNGGDVTDTVAIPFPDNCCNESVTLTFTPETNTLGISITDNAGSVTDTVVIPTGAGADNENTALTLGFVGATRVLTTTVSQTTGGDVTDTVTIPANIVVDHELVWDSETNTLQSTVSQTLDAAVTDSVVIPFPDDMYLTDVSATYNAGTGVLTVSVTDGQGTFSDTTTINAGIANTGVTLVYDEVTGNLTTTVTDESGPVTNVIDFNDLVLQAICNMPEVDINDASVVGPYFIFGTLDNGSCAKLVGEVCIGNGSGSEVCDLTLTSTAVNDISGQGTTNRQIDSTTVTLFFNEELGAGAVGTQDSVAQTNTSWLYLVDQAGDYVDGDWASDGLTGGGYGYTFTPSGDLLPNYSYTAGASVDTASDSDPSCLLTNSGNAVSFSTEPIPSNQVVNSGMDANVASWNLVNGTATYTAGGANGTPGYANIVGTGGNLQFRQDTIDVTNTNNYAIGFWHRGQDAQVRLTQSSSPFATIGLDYSTGVDANWTYHYVEFTATATEVNARLQFVRLGSPAAGYEFDIDEVYLGNTP